MTKTEKLIIDEQYSATTVIDGWHEFTVYQYRIEDIDDLRILFDRLIQSAVAKEREHNNAWHKQSMLRDLKYLKNCAIGNLYPLYTKEEKGECVAKQIDEMVEKLRSK